MAKKRVVIAGAVRTPVGVFGRRLKNVPAYELLRVVFKETIRRTGIDVHHLNGTVASTCVHLPDALNVARMSTLLLGLPDEDVLKLTRDGQYLYPATVNQSSTLHLPGYTVSRNCGSGIQAVISAVQAIRSGDGEIFLVGGTESMSNSPGMIKRDGFSFRQRDGVILDSLLHGLTDPLTGELMGVTADRVAKKHGITREEQDKFAVQSHQKAFKAGRSGHFKAQIIPVKVYERNVLGYLKEEMVSEDEGADPALSVGKISTLKPFFTPDGTVTPANACMVNDGAASFLVLNLEEAESLGLAPQAEIIGYGVAALDPSYMGEGPSCVIPSILAEAGMQVKDVDFFEINEAFAATTLATQRSLVIPDEKLNVNGGAIALGHPVGATGAILITKAIHLLKDFEKKYAMVSLCVGNGQGIGILLRNF